MFRPFAKWERIVVYAFLALLYLTSRFYYNRWIEQRAVVAELRNTLAPHVEVRVCDQPPAKTKPAQERPWQ